LFVTLNLVAARFCSHQTATPNSYHHPIPRLPTRGRQLSCGLLTPRRSLRWSSSSRPGRQGSAAAPQDPLMLRKKAQSPESHLIMFTFHIDQHGTDWKISSGPLTRGGQAFNLFWYNTLLIPVTYEVLNICLYRDPILQCLLRISA
jgi:hypothetical protein